MNPKALSTTYYIVPLLYIPLLTIYINGYTINTVWLANFMYPVTEANNIVLQAIRAHLSHYIMQSG